MKDYLHLLVYFFTTQIVTISPQFRTLVPICVVYYKEINFFFKALFYDKAIISDESSLMIHQALIR